MRALPFVLLACACGTAARAPAASAGVAWDADASAGRARGAKNGEGRASLAGGGGPGEDRGDDEWQGGSTDGMARVAEADEVFASMVARGAVLAPGMRVVTRIESAGAQVELVRAGNRDVCVRAAFEATAPVTARLVDSGGRLLATSGAPASEGTLGPRGPVCVRKGDVVAGASDGPAHVHWVAWAALGEPPHG